MNRQVALLPVVGGLLASGAEAAATRSPALVAKVTLLWVPLPLGTVNVPVVATTPVSLTGITVVFAIAAAPVTCPVMVSVPDMGVADLVADLEAVAAVLLLDDEHAPTAPTSARAPVRAASLFVLSRPICFSLISSLPPYCLRCHVVAHTA